VDRGVLGGSEARHCVVGRIVVEEKGKEWTYWYRGLVCWRIKHLHILGVGLPLGCRLRRQRDGLLGLHGH
jgi:hypothetical protein